MAVSLSLQITQNSQSIANNQSSVTVKVIASWTQGSWNGYQQPGWVKIDGEKHTFTSSFNTGQTTSGSVTLFTKTVTDVDHDSDGTKILVCSAQYDTDVSSGVITATATKSLTTIPRKSELTVADGTLGTAQTLTITEKATAFYHILKYECGTASGWIIGSSGTPSSTLSTSWTPPLSLAAQNTAGDSVSIKFTLYTYSGSAASSYIGENTYTKTFTIPASVKPTVSIAVSDPTGYLSTYGKYVQGKSTINVVVTASGSQGSTIKTYSTTANDASYSDATFTTAVVKKSGTLTITTTVTDSRGRTATATQNINVHAYSAPTITALKAERCNSGGTLDSSGAYLKVTFSSAVSSLKNGTTEKNTATYKFYYKKSTASAWSTAETLSSYANNLAVSNGTKVFAADTASSYDVMIEVADKFGTVQRETLAQSAFSTWSWLASGLGWAFGKVAELSDYLDVNFKAKFRKTVEMDSTLDVTGATTLDSTLNVAGATTLDGDLTGKKLSGTILKTTSASDLGSRPSKIAVLNSSGEVCYRTPQELSNDMKIGCTYQIGANVSITSGTTTKLTLTGYVVNTNGAFSLSDGGILIPYTGTVIISGGVYILGGSGATKNACFVYVYRNGSAQYSFGSYSPNAGNVSSGMKVLPVNAGDIVYLYARGYDAAGTVHQHSGTYLSVAYI